MIGKDFLCAVNEQDVHSLALLQVEFLSSPAFSYASLQKIPLDCPLEVLFRHGNKDAVGLFGVTKGIDVSYLAFCPMSAMGKKVFDTFLAAQSFRFGKSIGARSFHSLIS